MMLHEAIRNARTEHTVYFLLTAYLETLQFSRKLPERLTVLPIADMQDMQARFEQLVAEYETELRMPNSHQFFVLLEAVGVFDLAALRVCQLKSDATESAPAINRMANQGWVGELNAV